jgi:hypothetical protein
MTADLIGQRWVGGLADRGTLVKQVERGGDLDLYSLHSSNEKPILDGTIAWGATVDGLSRRTRR